MNRTSMRLAASALILSLTSLAVYAAPAGAVELQPFHATITEGFSFFGCPSGIDPFTVDTCGTATSPGHGSALVGTVITAFVPLASGCFHDEHTTTLTFSSGVLTVAISGTLCPIGQGGIQFKGRYDVAAGTGAFAGASGSGIDVAVRQNGPIVAQLTGIPQH